MYLIYKKITIAGFKFRITAVKTGTMFANAAKSETLAFNHRRKRILSAEISKSSPSTLEFDDDGKLIIYDSFLSNDDVFNNPDGEKKFRKRKERTSSNCLTQIDEDEELENCLKMTGESMKNISRFELMD